MHKVLFQAVPFCKEEVTLALESGVDGVLVPQEHVATVSTLARCLVIAAETATRVLLESKADESTAATALRRGAFVILEEPWEIIPVENLLAVEEAVQNQPSGEPTVSADETSSSDTGDTLQLAGESVLSGLGVMAATPDKAKLAAGILERGVESIVVPAAAIDRLKEIVAIVKHVGSCRCLSEAVITEITPVGMGHRVCVDTLSLLETGQGMLVGNSAACTFLVHAETESNEYVASRPFRINAGGVHAYAMMARDTTAYLAELTAGTEIAVTDWQGNVQTAVVGRVKIEQRPMLLIRARTATGEGTIFLQNAETIRLVRPNGVPVSVVALQVGDTILCQEDTPGRHFGMRISEDIREL